MTNLIFPLILFFALMINTSYPKPVAVTPAAKPLAPRNLLNVSYGKDAAQKMDVYLPVNRDKKATNILLLVHGGSWANGDKKEFDRYISSLQKFLPNYAIVNMNYRLAYAQSNIFPAQLEDVDTVIGFIKTQADEYSVNADKIIILGASAGAHLGMLKAYKENGDNRIKAVIDLFGPNDLVWLYTHHPFLSVSQSLLQNFLGTTYPENPGLYKEASPINYLTPQSPPTMIFHGGADYVVPISESKRLQQKLDSLHVENKFISYPNGEHGLYTTDHSDMYSKMASFLGKVVK